MSASATTRHPMNMSLIKRLTYVMFAMFAMTTDSVVHHHSPDREDVWPEVTAARGVSIRHDGRYCSSRLPPGLSGGPE